MLSLKCLALRASRKLRSLSLLAAVFCCAQGWAQMPGMTMLSPSSGASLPDAPSASLPLVRAAALPSQQPLVLPRNFRIAPAATQSNKPEKIMYYLHSTWQIRNFAEAMAVAGIPNLPSVPCQPRAPGCEQPTDEQYEAAMDAYSDHIDTWRRTLETDLRYHGYRYGVGFATAETRDLFSNLVLPLALHQEGRYIPAPVNSDFGERMMNAVASIVVTRSDAGRTVPNYSKLGGTVAAAFLGKSLYANAFKAPELNSNRFVMHYIGYSLLGDLATNAGHELIRAAVEPDLTYYTLHGRSTDDAYYPLSLGGKLMYWARSTYAVRNVAGALLIAGIPSIPSEPVEPTFDSSTWHGYATYDDAYSHYGDTVLTWKDGIENDARYHARRFAGGLSESETQTLLGNLLIPVVLNMDPRYVPLGSDHPAGQRFAHAVEGLWVTHTDSGKRTINLPVLGGTFGAALLAKEAYYPKLDVPALASNGVLAKTVGLNLAADALYNVIGEFLRHRGY